MAENKSETIPCPHFTWKLFIRNKVFYADGRKHGLGKPDIDR